MKIKDVLKGSFRRGTLPALLITAAALTGCAAADGEGSGNLFTMSEVYAALGHEEVEDIPLATCIAIGIHRNFPAVSLNTDSIYDTVYDTCLSYGDFSAVVIDGDPYMAASYSLEEPDKNIDSAKEKQIASQNTEQILSGLSNVSAQTPEVDTLEAIRLGADQLGSVTGEAEKSLIIIDSGLQTTGLLDQTSQNIVDEPVESLVSQLTELHAIPDLTGVNVTWIGLGSTSGEQADLTASYKYKLQERMEAILLAGGAASVTFDSTPVTGEEAAGDLPAVSVVPVVEDALDLAANVTAETMPESIKWDDGSSICFEGDSAEFVDADAAREELTPVAEYLAANPDERIYLFGMTATMTGEGPGIELALERAEACRDVLISLGAGEGQIAAVGLGQLENPLRVNDVDESGRQIEELAAKNRAVVLAKADSPLVDVLLQSAAAI